MWPRVSSPTPAGPLPTLHPAPPRTGAAQRPGEAFVSAPPGRRTSPGAPGETPTTATARPLNRQPPPRGAQGEHRRHFAAIEAAPPERRDQQRGRRSVIRSVTLFAVARSATSDIVTGRLHQRGLIPRPPDGFPRFGNQAQV